MNLARLSPITRTLIRKAAVAVAFGVVVVVLLLWLAGAFHPKIGNARSAVGDAPDATPGRRAVDVELVPVRSIQAPRVESAVGTVRAVHETALASKLLARVTEVNVKAGQPVRSGDVLVKLDDADLKARLDQATAAENGAQATRDQARIEFDRLKRLAEQGVATQIEFDRAETALKSADAEFERATRARDEARTIAGYAVISSPIDGTVVDKKVDVGDTVTPGQALVTLYDPARMQLVARVRESLTRRLKVGDDVQVRIEALNKTCAGQVSEIVPEAESASRAFSVKVTGPCPPDVYTGMFGRLLIPLDSEDVVVVPRAAVRQVGQLHLVDVADGDTLRRRTIQPGRTFGEDVEVLSGLRVGESVALPRPASTSEAHRNPS